MLQKTSSKVPSFLTFFWESPEIIEHYGFVCSTMRQYSSNLRLPAIAKKDVCFVLKNNKFLISKVANPIMAKILEVSASQDRLLQQLELIGISNAQVPREILNHLNSAVEYFFQRYMPSKPLFTMNFEFIRAETKSPGQPQSMFAEHQNSVWVAWVPLSSSGMFLQLWYPGRCEGLVLFIPYGTTVVVSGHTVVGKGLCSCSFSGNLALELCIHVGGQASDGIRDIKY